MSDRSKSWLYFFGVTIDDERSGAYEAKTNLSELLRKVQQGERFTITKHGKPIAALIPIDVDQRERQRVSAIAMRELMASPAGQSDLTADRAQIKTWMVEGRK